MGSKGLDTGLVCMLGHPAFPALASGEETAGMSGEVITVYPGQEAPGSWDGCILIHASASWAAGAIALPRRQWTGEGRLVVFAAGPRDQAGDDQAGDDQAGDDQAGLARWHDFAFAAADAEALLD